MGFSRRNFSPADSGPQKSNWDKPRYWDWEKHYISQCASPYFEKNRVTSRILDFSDVACFLRDSLTLPVLCPEICNFTLYWWPKFRKLEIEVFENIAVRSAKIHFFYLATICRKLQHTMQYPRDAWFIFGFTSFWN